MEHSNAAEYLICCAVRITQVLRRGGCAAFAQDDTSLSSAGEGVELDFAGLAVAGLDGVNDAGADVGGDGEAVDEDEDGLGEVEREEGFGRGELDDLAGLIFTIC